MNNFVNFLTKYGIGGLIIVALAFILTQLIKIPLKKYAEKYAEKNGVDKAVLTKWYFTIPLVLAFIGSIINQWAIGGWGSYICSDTFNWTAVLAETVACAGVTGSVYGIVESFTKASTSKQLAKLTKENSKVAEARVVIANETVTAADTAKAEKEAAKQQLKLDQLSKKQEKLEAKKAEKVEKLKAELAKLENSSNNTNSTNNEVEQAIPEASKIEAIN